MAGVGTAPAAVAAAARKGVGVGAGVLLADGAAARSMGELSSSVTAPEANPEIKHCYN